MKMSRLISVILLGVTLVAATPIYAQRGGGGRSGGSSSSSSHSSGGSRSSGGSFSSSSRGSSSSSSRSSSSFSSSSSRSGSSSSFSSSPSRSSSSYSSPSSSSSRASGTPSSYSSSSYSGSSSYGGLRSSGSASGNSSNNLIGSRSSGSASRTGSVPTQMRSSKSGTRVSTETAGREDAVRANTSGVRTDGSTNRTNTSQAGSGRPSGIAPVVSGGGHNHGGGHHPHHNPYYGDPRYHQIYWDPFPPRPYYWPGFWVYCDSYWYDYHVTDIVVVREYMKDTYNMELVTYAIGGEYMYALVNDRDGHTYLQVYDKNDKLLAEQQVSRKYIKMEIDPQNGGCWIMKKRDKDALLFLYFDGQLLIYEADK